MCCLSGEWPNSRNMRQELSWYYNPVKSYGRNPKNIIFWPFLADFQNVLKIIWERYEKNPWICTGHTKLLRYPHNQSSISFTFHSTLICIPMIDTYAYQWLTPMHNNDYGLGPENVSFLFKLLHDILPTQERVARTKPRASPACPLPGCDAATETRAHALVLCEGNNGVGLRAMRCLQSVLLLWK